MVGNDDKKEVLIRILLPVDGSIYSQNAIKFVAARKPLLGENLKVELLNVQELVPEDLADDVLLMAVNAYTKAASAKVFDQLAYLLEESGLAVEKKGIAGPVGDTIAEEAKKTGTDLVVMGTHGRSGFTGLFLGSVSIRVLSKTDRPVLLLREDNPVIEKGLRVGICVDDPAHASAAAKLVAEEIAFFGEAPAIKVIHVKTSGESTEAVVEPVMKKLADKGISADIVDLEGLASEAIADYAEGNLDLLVMGSHGYGHFTAAVMGSTTSRVAAKTNLPVLIVKA